MANGPDGLEQQFIDELRRAAASNPGVTLLLGFAEAWCLMAALQLACRHPHWSGPSRSVAEQIARSLQSRLAVTPALAAVAERGWNSDGSKGD